MTTPLLMALVRLAIDQPELAAEIRDLAVSAGVAHEQFEDMAHIHAMNDAAIGTDAQVNITATAEAPHNPDPAKYLTVRSAIPTGLSVGDTVYTASNATLFWVTPGDGENTVPAGFNILGRWDGTTIVGPA